MIVALFVNVILLGSYVLLSKYGVLFEGIKTTNKIARNLNDKLENLN